jgi:UDP-glucose 4-epimerase
VRLRPVPLHDASGISCVKADKLLGWVPLHGWPDMFDTEGDLLPVARDRR